MSAAPGTDRADVEARLAQTRQEVLALFQPEIDAREARARNPNGSFPRSRTMRLLLSHKGLAGFAAAACGLLISRPALAMRLIRLLPVAAIAKLLLRRRLSA